MAKQARSCTILWPTNWREIPRSSCWSSPALAGEADISFCLVASHTGPIVIALAAAELIERFEIFPTVDEAERNR
jgi:hypothetical protein